MTSVFVNHRKISCGFHLSNGFTLIMQHRKKILTKGKTYAENQSSCSLWYSIAVWPSTSSTRLPYWKLQSHLKWQEKKSKNNFVRKKGTHNWWVDLSKRQKTYSKRVVSMLITSWNIASHEASTTPTAFIALLQLLAYERYTSIKHEWSRQKYSNYQFTPTTTNLQGNQHPGAPQKCGDLK